MDPLSLYYIRQGGRGERFRVNDVIGPVYATAPFVQRGHGIGSFLAGLFRFIRPIFVSGAKAVGRESLKTIGKILSDIAGPNRPSDVQGVRDIVAKHVSESAQGLIHKALSGRGGTKRKTSAAAAGKHLKTKKRAASSKRSTRQTKRRTTTTINATRRTDASVAAQQPCRSRMSPPPPHTSVRISTSSPADQSSRRY
jgi:hypothetical protein